MAAILASIKELGSSLIAIVETRRPAAVLTAVALVAAACGSSGDDGTAPGSAAEPDEGESAVDDEADADPVDDPDDLDPLDAVGDGAWTTLAQAPQPLSEVGVAAFGGELWVAGGLTVDANVTSATQVFDPESGKWRRGPELPEPVHHASLVATDRDLVLVGGYRTLGFDPVTDVFVLDQDHDGWAEAPSLPEARGAGAAVWDGERLVFGGGCGEDVLECPLGVSNGLADEVWALDDVDGGEWTEVGQLSVARDHLASASNGDGVVWFLGGRENSPEANLGTVDLLTADGIAPLRELLTPRGGVAAFFSDEHGACVAGGEQPNGIFAEVECVTVDGTATVLPDLSLPRHGLGAAIIDGIAYIALGGPEPLLSASGTIEALRVDQ